MSVDIDVLIIGAGISGIGFAIQLQKKYPRVSFEIIEKADGLGGTWWVNTYPGCGCDVASHFYSLSFALNPDWSKKFAPQSEIAAYCQAVAEEHGIPRHVTFSSTVQNAAFEEATGTWIVTILEQQTGRVYQKRSRVLISAVGALSVPRDCEIKGAERYNGKLFHSARWDHTLDWAGKDIVVIGNGCSATQFVPVLSDGPGKAKNVVQFSRQAHWLAERPNPTYSSTFKWTMRYVPLAMRMYRFYLYYMMERDFAGFDLANGGKIREEQKKIQLDYLLRTAPERYHEALAPKTEIGCKRKVMDMDYLACLHQENMELVYSDPVAEVTETGVKTESGREVHADAIILANGFKTQQVLYPIEITGEKGVSLTEHWDQFSSGSAQAYYGTCVSEFPNLFIMMGPNITTGHLSVIFSTECQMNFTLRVLESVLDSLYPSLLSSLNPFTKAIDTVAVTPSAEERDNTWIQAAASKLVWASGCSNWYVDARTGRNTMLYPDWQFKFWLRSIFFPLSRDFVFRSSSVRLPLKAESRALEDKKKNELAKIGGVVAVSSVAAVVGMMVFGPQDSRDARSYISGLCDIGFRAQKEFMDGFASLVSRWEF